MKEKKEIISTVDEKELNAPNGLAVGILSVLVYVAAAVGVIPAAMALDNGSTWAYAHKVSGIHWLICGAIGLLCPIALAVLGFTGTIYGNGCLYGLLAAEAFQQILLLSVIPVTEHKLKNKFNEDGTLR